MGQDTQKNEDREAGGSKGPTEAKPLLGGARKYEGQSWRDQVRRDRPGSSEWTTPVQEQEGIRGLQGCGEAGKDQGSVRMRPGQSSGTASSGP